MSSALWVFQIMHYLLFPPLAQPSTVVEGKVNGPNRTPCGVDRRVPARTKFNWADVESTRSGVLGALESGNRISDPDAPGGMGVGSSWPKSFATPKILAELPSIERASTNSQPEINDS